MSNVDPETVSYEPAGPRVVWPRNSAGAYATIAELMAETTEATEHGWAIPLTLQAYDWIMHVVHCDMAIHHSLP